MSFVQPSGEITNFDILGVVCMKYAHMAYHTVYVGRVLPVEDVIPNLFFTCCYSRVTHRSRGPSAREENEAHYEQSEQKSKRP